MALMDGLYEDMTLSSTVSEERLPWYPAACRGNLLKRPVGTHETRGQLSLILEGGAVKPRASRTGLVTVSHSHSSVLLLPKSHLCTQNSISDKERLSSSKNRIWWLSTSKASQRHSLTLTTTMGP